jgi:hypothetical protein
MKAPPGGGGKPGGALGWAAPGGGAQPGTSRMTNSSSGIHFSRFGTLLVALFSMLFLGSDCNLDAGGVLRIFLLRPFSCYTYKIILYVSYYFKK